MDGTVWNNVFSEGPSPMFASDMSEVCTYFFRIFTKLQTVGHKPHILSINSLKYLLN